SNFVVEYARIMGSSDITIANRDVLWFVRHSVLSPFTCYRVQYCDRSTMESAGTSCRGAESWAARLMVESSPVLERRSPRHFLHVLPRFAKPDVGRSGVDRGGDAPRAGCD